MNAAAKSSERSHSGDYFRYTFAHAARRLPLRSYPLLSTAHTLGLFKRILPHFRGATREWIRQALIWGVTTAIRRKHFSGGMIPEHGILRRLRKGRLLSLRDCSGDLV